jgi:hypothetical protein
MKAEVFFRASGNANRCALAAIRGEIIGSSKLAYKRRNLENSIKRILDAIHHIKMVYRSFLERQMKGKNSWFFRGIQCDTVQSS